MGNKTNRNLLGIFALLAASFILLGCTSPPPAPVVCGTDVYSCQDGSYAARNPADNCQFTPCPQTPVCAREATLCSDGTYVGRNISKGCAFDACPPNPACPLGAKLCIDGSYVVRNPSKNCAFDTCPIVIAPPANVSNLAGVGDDCAGVAGIRCQLGLQCIISGQIGAYGTCTVPAPPLQNMTQCPSDRYTGCTDQIDPVCGKGVDDKATFRDYENACVACSVGTNAIGYYTGTCENQ
ncbi:MAG: hypothetical protein WC717_02110 [Candidatus Micrarchaeia archaeon]|jgi:hypothetical protein